MTSTTSLPAARRLPRLVTGALLPLALVLAAAASPASASTPTSGFGDQWDLQNTGQFSGTPSDDIDIQKAWELEPGGGNASVLVGAVDSGVNFSQPGLEHANLYTQGKALDADDTLCATASYGCDFVTEGATPSDQNGHGTATAGVIAGGWGESPYAGVAPSSTLIVARVLDSSEKGNDKMLAAGLNYVANRGARVVNVSINGPRSGAVHEAIALHPQTLFVVSAGNSGVNIDASTSNATYPCSDPSPNVICVAATDSNDKLASFSNYGASTVDLAAPGKNIATLSLEGSSDTWYGTSFSTPLVTGTAALAFALRPKATVAQVKTAILESVDKRSSLEGKTVTGGRLDAGAALLALQAMLPAAPPAIVTAPAVSGDATVAGSTLTATTGNWSGAPTSTSIGWERCDQQGGHCQLIAGASGTTYKVTGTDGAHTIRAEVTATNSAGGETAFSEAVPHTASAEASAGTPGAPSAATAPGAPVGTAAAVVLSTKRTSAPGGIAQNRNSFRIHAAAARVPETLKLSVQSVVTSPQQLEITVRDGAKVKHLHLELAARSQRGLVVHLIGSGTTHRAQVRVRSSAATSVEAASVRLLSR